VQTVQQWQATYQLPDVIVGMDSTGHYWLNLGHWLSNQGIAMVFVNPATTKCHKENPDKSPSKNDTKDTVVITNLVGECWTGVAARRKSLAATTPPTSAKVLIS
jgi:transposase